MTSEKPDIHAIFDEAIVLASDEERLPYLDIACGNDAEIRRRVDALLRAHSEAGDFFGGQPSARAATEVRPVTEQPGDTIGPYKLLQQIGEGGMGVVYMAEQTEPVERRVALKIIKPGMDTRQVIARFEAERQALAMMDHPNIAKVLDAGTTDSGRPYFVMELVKGASVTKYCDEYHLTPKQRLELFVPICQAVQHAHQKGIIHRDIKPSNILVARYDGNPVPKVIDFGVAKATGRQLTDKTMFTQYGQIVGTVEYMSPEQAELNQADVDTRSDIYSLGVVLYELLTGETPFDKTRLRSAAFDELLRIIREEEPLKPSIKLSSSESLPSIADNRRIDAHTLGTMIRGELDWIVMKALEKDRGRRYETANKFAEDVEHYLNDEAVEACPPSVGYKFRKFARRNKVVLGTTATIALLLIAGIAGTTWQAIRATQQRNRAVLAEEEAITEAERASDESARADVEAKKARTEAAIATAVREFLEDDLLGLAGVEAQLDEEFVPDPNIKLRTVVDRAAKGIDDRFVDRPAIKKAICSLLGSVYVSLGQYDKAETLHREALEIGRRVLGLEHDKTLNSMNNLASSLAQQGQFKEAEELLRETLETRRRVSGLEHPDTLRCMNNLAGNLFRPGQYEEAEKLQRETLEIQRRVLGPEHPDIVDGINDLAISLFSLGRYDEAEQFYREMLQIRRALGPEDPVVLNNISDLAATLVKQRQYKEAEKLQRETLEIQQRVLGPRHHATLRNMQNLAISLSKQGQHKEEEAEKLLRETLEIRRNVLGPEHPDTLSTLNNLANSLSRLGHYKKMEKLLRETLKTLERTVGVDDPRTIWGRKRLVSFLASRTWRLATTSDPTERIPEEAVRAGTLATELAPENPNNWSFLGVAQYRAGDFDAALESLLKADGMIDGGDRPHRMLLAMTLWQLGRKEDALAKYAEGAAWITAHPENNELERFREEAESLLKVDAKQSDPAKDETDK